MPMLKQPGRFQKKKQVPPPKKPKKKSKIGKKAKGEAWKILREGGKALKEALTWEEEIH